MGTDPIVIRPATVDDVPTIFAMIKGLAAYEKLSDMVTATEDGIRATLFGPRPAAEVLLASRAGECRGFALFFGTYSTFLGKPGVYLEDLFVDPDWRGQGIGRALLEAITALARERGCGRVEWEVLDWNAPAIDFYERLGAKPQGGWTKYCLLL